MCVEADETLKLKVIFFPLCSRLRVISDRSRWPKNKSIYDIIELKTLAKKAYPKLITDCKESNPELGRRNDIKTVCQIYEESPSSW